MVHHTPDGEPRAGLTGAVDTIAAPATPPGRGGVGIVRVSGPAAPGIAVAITGRLPRTRQATAAAFREATGGVLDRGLALYFPAPRSYTGEHVLELHAHGGAVVLDLLLAAVYAAGARPAEPGEFTRRAYLNGKLDLAQAEAVADLIDASSGAAARAAARSLQGAFSARVLALVAALTDARVEIEAALDFADEGLDLEADAATARRLDDIAAQLAALRGQAGQGHLLQEGQRVVLAGAPNVGKSSLMNALARRDAAIVTAVPGTTRDVLRETLLLDTLTVQLADTAGLRDSDDPIEQEGVRRARAEIAGAGHVLYVTAAPEPQALPADIAAHAGPVTLVVNKIDLTGAAPRFASTAPGRAEVWLSASTGAGLDLLTGHLAHSAGLDVGETVYGARRRHLVALDAAAVALARARAAGLPELLAQGLREAALALTDITGPEHPEALLGEIFGRFCVGK